MLSSIMSFLDKQVDEIMAYDDRLTKRLVKEIEVHEDRVLITFKHNQMVEISI